MATTQSIQINGSTSISITDPDPDPDPPSFSSPTEPGLAPVVSTTTATAADNSTKWPGWPGHCVFRLIVPVLKVGSIIGRKGDLIKKMCEDTRARIRVLDGPVASPDRVVLITGKEEPEAALSPAMDALMRIFKRVSGLSDGEGAQAYGVAGVAFCSIRLLVASTQAINLIGKQGSLIKSIQESTGASVRVLSTDEVLSYVAADERILELQGEALKVLKALEAVVGHLRKFLVDHSILFLFEKNYNSTKPQDRQGETLAEKPLPQTASESGMSTDYPLSAKRNSLFVDRETQLESQLTSSGISLYGQDHSLSAIRSTGIGRAGGPIVTRMAQTMEIPFTYAEDIIGIDGANIAYIRRTSGAIIAVQESSGLSNELTVDIKGTLTQVQMAYQLIQEFMSNHKEPLTGSYGKYDTGLRPSYSQLGIASYSSSSLSSQRYGGYGSSDVRGYTTFRL
ncbi:KH_1 domain-containing protein [Cephalotus follicularis]|uniref:KH_1 domain-containing protein n=1 Tax=Cephalotus follicularis TaxID=3775 RepID=A0A1Q3CVH5_CEPFO|nr:KH_1 domain-containing protein [Cephalotus follicularis]